MSRKALPLDERVQTYGFAVYQHHMEALRRVAAAQQTSVSALVRQIIDAYLDAYLQEEQ